MLLWSMKSDVLAGGWLERVVNVNAKATDCTLKPSLGTNARRCTDSLSAAGFWQPEWVAERVPGSVKSSPIGAFYPQGRLVMVCALRAQSARPRCIRAGANAPASIAAVLADRSKGQFWRSYALSRQQMALTGIQVREMGCGAAVDRLRSAANEMNCRGI